MRYWLFLLFLAPSFLYAEEPIIRVVNPIEVRSELSASIPPELEGLQWNRWTSKNFTVCSLNDLQAQYLHKHLELVKSWAFRRWGMADIDFSAECKLICVDDPILFKKIFGLDATRVEVRRDASGKIKESVIFLLVNESPSRTVPVPLTEVCLAEYGQKTNKKFAFWAYKGMAQLNSSLDQVRLRIKDVKPHLEGNNALFYSKSLLEMDQVQYLQLSDEKKRVYEDCAMIFCLMIRKEFGQDNFLGLLNEPSNPELSLKKATGFDQYTSFDQNFRRYLGDITKEVELNKTPDHYLQIKEK